MKFLLYSELNRLKQKRIVIMGVGRNINPLVSLLKHAMIIGFYDNDKVKVGSTVGSLQIKLPKDMALQSFDYCILNSLNYFVLENQLKEYNIETEKFVVPPVELFYEC